jgi:esterase/lipase superfamily enzyme
MFRQAYAVRIVIFLLALGTAARASAQVGKQLVVIDGSVSKKAQNGAGPGMHLVNIEQAIIVLCATAAEGGDCVPIANTLSDSAGQFEIALDNVVPSSTYVLRARSIGEVWSELTLGSGQDVATWPKSAQITLGSTPSLRENLDREAISLQLDHESNLQKESQILDKIQTTQREIYDEQRAAQTSLAAMDNPTALPTDKAAFESQIRDAHAKVQDEQREVLTNQETLADVRAVDATRVQDRQAVLQQSMLDQRPPQFGTKRVIFATDRKTSLQDGKQRMLNERNDAGQLQYGICDAAVERQGDFLNNILYWINDRDSERFYSIQNISLLSKGEMWTEAGAEFKAAATNDALLFIHGFKVPFDDACRRAAQIAFDIKFPGPVFLYSWSSHASMFAYADDGKMAEASEPNFTNFVKEILARPGIGHLHILAHSMGNRILMHTLFVDKLTPPEQAHLGQVVFAAPDVDRTNFDKYIVVSSIKPMRVTLYASDRDQALAASKIANCGRTLFFNCVGRVGDARPNIDIQRGMDSLDASAVDTSLMGHSYIGNARSVLADLAALISDNRDPGKRFGVLQEGQSPNIWWLISP